ncbi:MAG: hypothetical protein NTU54_02730 [Candidatus Omnitrophica bacterium]|nr:hypothetical protein [Candidatus Omnitrophota bacterium]
MKKIVFSITGVLMLAAICFAQDKGLLLDDFEGALSGGPDGTVDFGAGNGSSLEVTAAADIVHSGKQSLKANFDAVTGGYMYIAKGFGLDAKNSAWLVKPQDIDWKKYNAISFYMFGADTKTKVAIDIKDNGNEMWRFMVTDDFKGWKKTVIPFKDFFVRGDWQPDNADKNAVLDLPIKSYQLEPLPPAKGTLYFDQVELEQL